MSSIALFDQRVVQAAMDHLAAELAAGRWHARHGYLLKQDELDLGYRLVARPPRSSDATPASAASAAAVANTTIRP